MSNTDNTKRKYERIDPDKYPNWGQPPKIIYDENGKVLDRREYDRWYAKNRRKTKPGETYEEKQARYKRYSRDYWTQYCLDNGLDPETWEKVRKRVLDEKRRINANNRAGSRRNYRRSWGKRWR